LAAVFAAAFILAFGIAWLIFQSSPPAPLPPPQQEIRVLTKAEVDGFLQAVADGDYETMNRVGNQLFAVGNKIPDSRELLDQFQTNTYSDVEVYALFSRIGEKKTTRVLLTVDKNDTVVSFLAEEMPLIR
jgi:hypothetical protein